MNQKAFINKGDTNETDFINLSEAAPTEESTNNDASMEMEFINLFKNITDNDFIKEEYSNETDYINLSEKNTNEEFINNETPIETEFMNLFQNISDKDYIKDETLNKTNFENFSDEITIEESANNDVPTETDYTILLEENTNEEATQFEDSDEKDTPNLSEESMEEKIERRIKEAVNEQLDSLNVVSLKEDYIVFDNVTKEYSFGTTPTIALKGVSFKIDEGELVIFLGHSGAGKTTALNMLGGMDTVTSGSVIVDGRDITKYDYEELTEYRRKDIGFVFQFYNLIQNLSAKENIELSTEISEEKLTATKCLEEVGLLELADKFPNQLSGGEQQRVAIARALAKKPKILLCDEPTGALDYKTGKQVLKLIQDTCKKNKITTVIITHNQDIIPMADKVIYFNSGEISKCVCNPKPLDIEEFDW